MNLTPKQQEFVRRTDPGEGFSWTLGWPDYEYERVFIGHFKCNDCGKSFSETTRGYEDDDLDFDNWCDSCDSVNVSLLEVEDTLESWEDRDQLGFSRSDCDCCGSPLAGNRYAASLLDHRGDLVVVYSIRDAVCEDCLFYMANGDVPDDENLSWIDDEELDNALTHGTLED